ncbi:MAG: hypothetical protein IJH07_08965 [Ruminococcus sp.]|nr:hypothetical protein [Ruminococcus sp.]
MSEMRHSEIIYEEGWRETAPAVQEETPVDEAAPSTNAAVEKAPDSKPLLITIQLALCLIAALVLFLLKAMDSEGYYSFIDYYHDELQKPVVSQEVFSAADVSKLFAEHHIEIQATPDETARSED